MTFRQVLDLGRMHFSLAKIVIFVLASLSFLLLSSSAWAQYCFPGAPCSTPSPGPTPSPGTTQPPASTTNVYVPSTSAGTTSSGTTSSGATSAATSAGTTSQAATSTATSSSAFVRQVSAGGGGTASNPSAAFSTAPVNGASGIFSSAAASTATNLTALSILNGSKSFGGTPLVFSASPQNYMHAFEPNRASLSGLAYGHNTGTIQTSFAPVPQGFGPAGFNAMSTTDPSTLANMWAAYQQAQLQQQQQMLQQMAPTQALFMQQMQALVGNSGTTPDQMQQVVQQVQQFQQQVQEALASGTAVLSGSFNPSAITFIPNVQNYNSANVIGSMDNMPPGSYVTLQPTDAIGFVTPPSGLGNDPNSYKLAAKNEIKSQLKGITMDSQQASSAYAKLSVNLVLPPHLKKYRIVHHSHLAHESHIGPDGKVHTFDLLVNDPDTFEEVVEAATSTATKATSSTKTTTKNLLAGTGEGVVVKTTTKNLLTGRGKGAVVKTKTKPAEHHSDVAVLSLAHQKLAGRFGQATAQSLTEAGVGSAEELAGLTAHHVSSASASMLSAQTLSHPPMDFGNISGGARGEKGEKYSAPLTATASLALQRVTLNLAAVNLTQQTGFATTKAIYGAYDAGTHTLGGLGLLKEPEQKM